MFRMLALNADTLGENLIFDGRMLFLSKQTEDTLKLQATHNGINYDISIMATKIYDPESSELPIQFYDLVFKKILRNMRLKPLNRQYFDPSKSIEVRGHPVELWPGYVTSIRKTKNGYSLINDVTHKVLRTDTVLDLIEDCSRRMNARVFKDVATQKLLGQIVMTKYNQRTYLVDDVAWDLSPRSTFEKKSGEKITYLEYYESVHNITIKNADQALLAHRVRRKNTDETETIFLIPELCYMTGITDEMRSDFRMMKDVAVHTRVSPKGRVSGVESFMQKINREPETKKILNDWNMEISAECMRAEGMQLEAPELCYRGKTIPRSADWGREMRDSPLVEAKDLNDWLVISTDRDRPTAHELVDNMRQVGGPIGIRVNDPHFITLRDDHKDAYLNEIKYNTRESTQIVVCILPTNKKDRYDAIKYMCCAEIGVPSQCVVSKTLARKQSALSVCTKIIQQINCKLGGQLWTVNGVPPKSMIVGIDVCHDNSKAHGRRSVAGFCASTNAAFTKYYSDTSFQGVGQELVDGLKVFMSKALQEYNVINQTLPEWIFVYRDGVGDGMLPAVLEHEVMQITAVCDAIYKTTSIQPKYCFVVVKKRINTRIFAPQGGQLENPPPGTVLSQKAVTGDKDFFLISQSVRQGTVTPAHYQILYDTIRLKPEGMQKLTYMLCHLYYNWPGTIRVPAACHYAHKIAFLVGQSVHTDTVPSLRDKLFFL